VASAVERDTAEEIATVAEDTAVGEALGDIATTGIEHWRQSRVAATVRSRAGNVRALRSAPEDAAPYAQFFTLDLELSVFEKW
jgi:hypothetical protein